MKRGTAIFLGIILVLLVGVGVWLGTGLESDESSGQTTNQPAPVPAPAPQATAPQPVSQTGSATITYDNNGFNPASVTIKAGQTLIFINKSSATTQPSSDPHPQHTDNPELNVGNISAGKSKNITPSKTGTFGMHDHFKPSNSFSVTIE